MVRASITVLLLVFCRVAFAQQPEIRLIFPDDYHGSTEKKPHPERYFSLYEQIGKINLFKAVPFVFRDTLENNVAYGLNRRLVIDSVRPLFIVSGVGIKKRDIAGIQPKGADSGVFPDNSVSYTLGTTLYTVYATGEYIKDKDDKVSYISNYRVFLQKIDGANKEEQLLFSLDRLSSWGAGGFEGGAAVRWIGDLNGDKKVDLVLWTSSDFRAWEVTLYMTGGAPGKIVEGVAKSHGSAP
ncbi:hypothetical protein WSM22_33610 [Cytophagales bacterium WSM2-2]|nr:hypothetical protein WSM22_33610 [Cytophagales bacterium WSM2-2]